MRKCILTAAVLLLGAAVIQAGPPGGGSGPYTRLDPKKLTDTLRWLQMNELLGQVLGQQPATAAAATGGDLALAEEKVRLADKAGSAADRDRLLKEALEIYRKIGEEKPKNEADRWNRVFEARLRLIDAARTMAEPAAIRLMYLQGAEEDRKTVVALTDEAIKVLRDLKKAVDDKLMDYRQSSDKSDYVVYLRPASQVKGRIDAAGAYLRLYRGMALPAESPERKTLLNQLISSLAEYTKIDKIDDDDFDYRACLLTGIALRELGQHDQAAKMLGAAVSEKAPAEVRLQAMF
jgi:hypothetical protein